MSENSDPDTLEHSQSHSHSQAAATEEFYSDTASPIITAAALEATDLPAADLSITRTRLSTTDKSSSNTSARPIPSPLPALQPLPVPPVCSRLPAFREFCDQFNYLLFPHRTAPLAQQIGLIENLIQSNLTRLEEYSALIDSMKSTSAAMTANGIPQLKENSLQLQDMFQRIDKVSEFLAAVEECAEMLDQRVNQAEKAFKSKSGLTKMLSSVMKAASSASSSSSGSSAANKSKNQSLEEFSFQPVEIVNTEDYFVQ